MLGAFVLAATMAATPADYEPPLKAWVDAMVRDDRPAARGLRPLRASFGTSYDRLHVYDGIQIDWYRVAAVEQRDEATFVTIEMEGTAIEAHTRQHVPWPRWWSVNFIQRDGKWLVDTPMMLERRIAEDYQLASPDVLSAAVRAHPEIDLEAFAVSLGEHSQEHGSKACGGLLWLSREGVEQRRADVEGIAATYLSYMATLEPIDGHDAITSAQRAVALTAADRDADALSAAYLTLGDAFAAAGRIDEAVHAYRKASTFYAGSSDPRTAQRALFNASQLEISRNNLRAALTDAELYHKRLEGLASQHDRMEGAMLVATIHERLGSPQLARRYYEQALVQAEGKRDPEMQAYVAYKLAAQETAMGNAAEARRILDHAWMFRQFSDDPWVWVPVLTAVGANHRDAGDVGAAEGAFAGALETSRMVEDEKQVSANLIASVYVERGLLRLGEGKFEEALADARKAREQAGTRRADALALEGRALRGLGRTDEAEAVLRTAIEAVEAQLSEQPLDETGSAELLRQSLAPYRELLDLLAASGCAREALQVAERMRARSLRDAIRNGRVDLSAGLDETQRRRERELEAAIAEVNRKLLAATAEGEIAELKNEREEARLALRRFRGELYILHPEIEQRRAQTAASHETREPRLQAGELALELAVNDDATFLFALGGTGLAVHRIAVRREKLEKAIDAFVTALEQRDLTWRHPARTLYDLLLGPVADRIARADAVRIVPDGALWRLPFHALLDERGQHLIDRLPVSYAPSLALSQPPAARRSAPRMLLAYADPAIRSETASATRALYRDATLGRLPEAATEARAIARIYGDAEVRVGAEAREEAFKNDAAAFRVLHLAAHSIVDDRAPMYSSIVLAASGSNPLEDGLLEAREIADLRLDADLAVLSACETARGAVAAGEGVIGLSWAFLAAGVPTTVVSQWKVASASTADLMIAFHQHLHAGSPPSAALRAAMRELRKDARWGHPFYWAPFVVVANGGR